MKRSFWLLLLCCALIPQMANATQVTADPYATADPTCGDPPPQIFALLPGCGIVVDVLEAATTLPDGLWHGVCHIYVYHPDGDETSASDYEFLWIGATGSSNPINSHPTNCECQKARVRLCPRPKPDVCTEETCDSSPIVFSAQGNGIKLTSGPVAFDINADGTTDSIGWTDSGTLFLAYDRNHNGVIDSGAELFGTNTPGSDGVNGYVALAKLDTNGNGWVEPDEVPEMLIWGDANQNAVVDAGELRSAWGSLSRIGTDYRDGRRTDRWGNQFRWEGRAVTVDGRPIKTADVVFVKH